MAVTIADIARAAGVSKPVVSKVLGGRSGNTRVGAATRERVLAIATDLGYRPNAAARSIATGGTGHVAMLVPNTRGDPFTNPAAFETLVGLDAGLGETGRSTLLANVEDLEAALSEHRIFRERVVDALCVTGHIPRQHLPRIEELVPRCMWIDTNCWRDRGCVRRDERAAGEAIAAHALALGYRRLIFYTYAERPDQHFSREERRRGIAAAAKAAGAELHLMVERDGAGPAVQAEISAIAAPDTAILCDSIYQAQKVRSLCDALELRVGHDVGLGCCDDMRQMERWWPQLSRVRFPRYQMGRVGAAALATWLDDGDPPPSTLLTGELIPGATLTQR